MTQVKYASVKMPSNNLAGVIKGGRYWVSDDFTIATPATWNGIVLDYNGLIVGGTNKGMSVWKAGDRNVYISNNGDFVLGKAGGPQLSYSSSTNIMTLPAIITTILGVGTVGTLTGVLLDSTGLSGLAGGVKTFFIDSTSGNFTLGKAGTNQLTYTASTGVMTLPSIRTAILSAGDMTGVTGVMLDSTGLAGFEAGVKTVFLASATGNLTLGKAGGDQLTYVASTGIMTLPAIVTSKLAAGSVGSMTGVLLDSAGLACYLAGVQTTKIFANGDFTFGSTTNKKISFVASTGVLTIDKDVQVAGGTTAGSLGLAVTGAGYAYLGLNSSGRPILTISSSNIIESGANPTNGVVIDGNGMRGYASSVQVFGIDTSGNAFFSGSISAATMTTGHTLTLTGAGIIQTNGAGTFFINSTSAGSRTFSVGGSTLFGDIEMLSAAQFHARVNASGGGYHGLVISSAGGVEVGYSGTTYPLRVYGTVTAAAFSGPLTGNVTGNCSGSSASCTGNAATATTAGTVTTMSQAFRLLDGRLANNTDFDTLYLQYTAPYGVQIGDSGTDHPLVVCGLVTAYGGFSGNITGNVTGNCSGTAATVTGAAQTSITSLGNLTGLTLAGHANASAENTYDLGSSDTGYWFRTLRAGAVNANTVNYHNANAYGADILSDAWDDLALLDGMKYKLDKAGNPVLTNAGQNVMDIFSYPVHVLNFDRVMKKHELTKAEVKEILAGSKNHEKTKEDIEKDIAIDLNGLRGLQIGAIRQLNQKLEKLINEVIEWKKQK